LLGMPPFLYWTAKNCRHSWSGWQV